MPRSRSAHLLFACLLSSSGCQDETFGSKCGAGTIDRDGTCVPENPTLSCGSGTVSRNGECVPANAPLMCGAGTVEQNGMCVPESTPVMCGAGTMLQGSECVPIPMMMETIGVEGMIAYACRANRCLASLAVEYWNKHAGTIDGSSWDDHAVKRTITLVEEGARMGPMFPEFDGLLYRVRDDAGGSWDCKDGMECDGLRFEAGVPVTLTIAQSAGNLSTHYFTSPELYRSVAWRDVATADALYHAPAFDSFGAKRAATTSSVTLSFVPMVPKEYDSYCHLGVANGTRFSEIAAGAIEPNLATGHAGLGMYTDVNVEDPQGLFAHLSLKQDTLADRNPEYDVDTRGPNNQWWTNAAVNQGKCCRPLTVEMAETSETEYEYRIGGAPLSAMNPLTLIAEHGYQLTFNNTSTMRHHRFVSPQLYETSVMRRVEDSAADVRAPYLGDLEVLQGKSVLLSLIPRVAARYTSYCSIGVRPGAGGSVDLETGHAGSGMKAPVLVITSTHTSTAAR